MLISFTVENFRSIRDLQTLTMVAGNDDHLEWCNLAVAGKRRLLKSAAIYGANASGKTNVLAAITWFRAFVLNSVQAARPDEQIEIDPFKLSSVTEKMASHFEVEFFLDGWEYRYGFEVSSEQVEAEWLFRRKGGARPAKLFLRQGQEIDVSAANFKEGKGLEGRTRKDALFLTVCYLWNGPESHNVVEWINRLSCLNGRERGAKIRHLAKKLQEPGAVARFSRFVRSADINIQGLRSELSEIPDEPWGDYLNDDDRVFAIYPKLDQEGVEVDNVEFDLVSDESNGTLRFLLISPYLFDALDAGSVLVIDELEASLHPRLSRAIVDLFHSPVNRSGAQLVFSSHEVTLLEPERFRRDQVWFCEKDETGATDLYSLADFDSNQVRPTSKFSKQYMLGLFGAVPKMAHFQETAHATVRK